MLLKLKVSRIKCKLECVYKHAYYVWLIVIFHFEENVMLKIILIFFKLIAILYFLPK